MRSRLFLFFLLASVQSVVGQKSIPTTESFVVTGVVEKDMTIKLAEIPVAQSVSIPDLQITNHLGEPRSTAKGLRGVLMKNVLKDVPFKVESPKELSEFYLAFIASDGYSVVYSWNEIFNTPTGDNLYLIVEKEGKKLAEMPDRILVLTTTDFKTGRRNVKGLSKILVGE
jgi:hypothetical protein